MDLKDLLKKTESKNKTHESIKIKPFFIAMEDRPYDELLPKDTIKEKYAEKTENKILTNVEEPIIIEKQVEPTVKAIAAPPKPLKQKKVVFKKEKEEGRGFISKIESKASNVYPLQEDSSTTQEIKALVKNMDFNKGLDLEDSGKIFLLLAGWQKKLVDYFFEMTMRNGSQEIGPITTSTISQTLNITPKTLNSVLQRLKSKGIIYTICSKEGRGGWSIFRFNNSFYQELIANARIRAGLKTEIQQTIIPVQNIVNPPQTTDLPEIWSSLDFQDLSEYGFNKNHLIQIYKDQVKSSVILDLESMQHALDAFKFDMENNSQIFKEKIRTQSPTAFLINILSKGRPYNSFTPEKFKTPDQIAMLQYKEKKEQINKELQSLKDTYFETEFQSWYDSLTEQDADELLLDLNVKLDGVPEKLRITYKMRSFKEHFSQVIWQDVVKQLRKKV